MAAACCQAYVCAAAVETETDVISPVAAAELKMDAEMGGITKIIIVIPGRLTDRRGIVRPVHGF